MKTGSGVIPLTVTISDLLSNITIKGASLITSIKDILLKALASLLATSDASSNTSLPISMAVMVINNDASINIEDISKLGAVENISIIAENYINNENLAYGGSDSESGGFVAITVANQNTTASIQDSASITNGKDLTISSKEHYITKTHAQSGGTAYKKEDEEGEEGSEEVADFSFGDILQILSGIKNPSNNNEGLIGTDMIGSIKASFNNSLSGFNKEDEDEEEEKEESSTQIVGAVAISIIDGTNQASINTTGAIHISGLLNILSEAVSNHIIIADASAIKPTEEQAESVPFGMGVSVALGKVDYKNIAYIGSNANIKAKATIIIAQTEDIKKGEESENINNQLTIEAKGGYNKSDFGIGGAIAVSLYDGITKAYISDGVITLIDNEDANIIIQAKDYSNTETTADAGSQDDPEDSIGIGAGIAISLFDNEVMAYIGEVTINEVNNLEVSASSQGNNNTLAIAGAEGGTCIIPVLALNRLNNHVKASVQGFAPAILVNGEVKINATGIRNSQTEADAQAGGKDVAVGAAIAIALIDTSEYALLERSIGSNDKHANSVLVKAIGVGSHETSSYAGKNGGKEDSNDTGGEGSPEEEEKGSITDLIKSAVKTLNSLKGFDKDSGEAQDNTSKASETKAETTEGTLTFAAALALNILESNTIAAIGYERPVVIYTEDLLIITETNKDAIANADASATAGDDSGTNSKIGVGAAAGILNVKTINKAILGSNSEIHSDGDVIIKSIMVGVEERVLDEDGNEVIDEDGNEVTEENKENNFGVSAQSGAGGSTLNLAGSVALAMIDTTFETSIGGEVNAGRDVHVNATVVQVVDVGATSQAVKTIAGKKSKKRSNTGSGGGVGIGASFAMSTINTKVLAHSTEGSKIRSGGNTSIDASLTNEVSTIAEAGEDTSEDDQDPAPYNKTSLDAAVAISISNSTVKAIIGGPINENVNIEVGGNLIIDAKINSIIKTESKSNTNATNAAIGATVSINKIIDNIIASLAGNALVTGNVSISTDALTEDICIAYASASGVVTKKYADKLGINDDDILDGDGLSEEQSSSTSSLSALAGVSGLTETKNIDQGNGKTSKGSKISIAAAIAVNTIEHNVTASFTGKIINANAINIVANSVNNFKTYATGTTVSNGNAISVAVAVGINNSKNNASLGNTENTGDILVNANTQQNISDAYKGEIAVQAIAGSKAGTDGNFGAAGAVAIMHSNSQTNAYILDDAIVNTEASITIKAIEKSKLAIRAWGATLIGGTSDIKDQMGTPGNKPAGIGAAFAILYADNQINAYIGNNAQITAKAISVKAIKEKVESDPQSILDDLKELFPDVDIETIEDIINALNNIDLKQTAITYLNYITSNNYYVEAAGGSISNSNASFAGAGSFALLFFNNITKAYIGDGVSITVLEDSTIEGNSIEVIASSEINAMAIGGSIASGGENSIGLTAVVFDNKDQIASYIGENVSINGFTKDIDISARANQNFWTIAIGASNADKAGISGIVNVVLSENQLKAYIGNNSNIEGSGNLTICAENITDIRSILGGATYGTKVGVGVSCLFLTLSNSTEAYIGKGAILDIDEGIITAEANSKELILTISVNGAASQGISISVGPTIKLIDSKVNAYIGNEADVTAGQIIITADSTTNIIGITGAISASLGGNISVGAVNDTNTLEKIILAYIGESTKVNCTGDIDIKATSKEKIVSYVVGLAISSGVSGEGSIAIDLINNDVQAYIGKSVEINSLGKRAGNINILAKDDVDLLIIAGGLSASTGSAAIGISSSIVTFKGTTHAYIGEQAKIYASNINITADASEKIMVIVASGGASGNVTIIGSVNVIVLEQTTEASIKENVVINSNGSIMVIAVDKTDIINRVGTIGGAGTVAIGISSDTICFTKKVKALVLDGVTISSGENIIVYANSFEGLDIIVAGVGGSGAVAINGSASIIIFDNQIISRIGTDNGTESQHAIADADGSIAIMAEDTQNIKVIAGAANGSGSVAVAAGTSVITSTNKVNAAAGSHVQIDAYGIYAVLSYTGEKEKAKATYYGLLIGAYQISDIDQIVFCASGSGAVAASGAVATSINKSETSAKIQSYARINQGARQTHPQVVRVIAVSESSVDIADGGAAVSAYAGIGAAAVVVVQDKTTIAEISDHAVVYAKDDIVVIARAENNIDTMVVSMGGAIVGVSGSVAVISITDHTNALIGAHASLEAEKNVNINAYANHLINGKVGSIAGGAVGIGGAVLTLTLTAETIASIDNTVIVTADSIYLIANSYEKIDANVVGAAGGGIVAASGSVVVLVLNVTTQALAGDNISFNIENELKIYGKDQSIINGLAGGAAFAGTIGAGGSVVTILYRNTVTAAIGNGANIKAASITIIAQTDREIKTGSAMLSAGLGAVSGSVIVISIGKATDDSDTSTALTGEDTNTIDQASGDITGALNNTKINLGENNQGYVEKVNTQISSISINLGDFFNGAHVEDKTMAYIGTGGSTISIGDIKIEAIESTKITANAGAVSAGGVALGGAVIVATLNGTIESFAGGQIEAEGNLYIIARNNVDIIKMQTIAGTAGLIGLGGSVVILNVTGNTKTYASGIIDAVGIITIHALEEISANNFNAYAGAVGGIGLGAAVTIANISGNVHAYLYNGTEILNAEGINLHADLNIIVVANAFGAAVGVVAAGVSVSDVDITADVKAYADGVQITKVGAFTILANSKADISSKVIAASAGGVSGSGAVVNIIHNGSVEAYILGETSICSGGDVSVTAMGYENLKAQGDGLSIAGFASIGAVFVTITNNLKVDAYIENSNITTSGDIVIRAVNEGIVNATAKGTSGGLLAAGAAQTAKVNEGVKVNASVKGTGKLLESTAGNIMVLTHNDSTVNVKAQGCAIAGFVAGGFTKADVILNNVSKVTIGTGITLEADKDIDILASSYIRKDTYGSASAAALAGAINDVSTLSNITITTTIDIQPSAVLTALGHINIQAISDKYYKAYATAIAGGILAKGVAKAEQFIIDDVIINISDRVNISANGYIYISTNTSIIDGTTPVSEAIGGAGGLVAGTSVLARLDTTANSKINTGEYVRIKSDTGNITIIATGELKAIIKSKIKFTIDAISILATQSLATSGINSIVSLGHGTEIQGVDVTIHGEVNKIYVYADAFSETGSIVNTQSKPLASIITNAHGKVEGTCVNLIASGKLGIYGTVNDITLITKSYGYTAGGTGSIISTCENIAHIYGTINTQNSGSSMTGRDIEIIATSPEESDTTYTKEATYKADTVVEYVKKTIEKVVKVVEKVTEKVTKWMPWPINKIVKWVVKTVVKYVTILVDIIVEVILQSEVKSVVNGSYLNQNNVILNGDIYYGSNVPIDIVIDNDGNISGVAGINYVKDETNNIITIHSFASAATGSLRINSHIGEVSGNVKVHSNSILSELNIKNNSSYNLIIKDLSITTNDNPNACNYEISCSENNLHMEDVTDITEAPIICIISINNTDLTFAGKISGYSLILSISMNGGNIYMTSGAPLEVNKITITGAKNVGTNADRFKIFSYITRNSEGDINPEINIIATGDAYVAIGLRKYINNTDGTIDIGTIQMLDGAKIIKIQAANTLNATFSEAALIVAESTSDNITSTYTYTEYLIEQVYIDQEIEAYSEYEKELIEGDLYVRYEFDEESNTYIEKYYSNEECTIEYIVKDAYHLITETTDEGLKYFLISDLPESGYRYTGNDSEYIYDTDLYQGIGYDIDEGKYYLIKQTERLVTAELDETISIEGVKVDLVYMNGLYYIQDFSANHITITTQGTNNTTSNVFLEGDIIGEDSININAYNASDVIITGSLATNGNTMNLDIDGTLSLNGNGSIIGNIVSTIATIKAGNITTDKGTVERTDILAKELKFTLNNGGMGSVFNPMAITTGTGGLSITANGAYPITIVSFTEPLYIKKIDTMSEVLINSKYKLLNVLGNTETNIIANRLTLNISENSNGIGTSDDYIVLNIGIGGIYLNAKDDIYLKQIGRAAYINNITNNNSSISFISIGDIIITNITAKTYVDLNSISGNIISLVNEEAIKAETITLNAGGNIGSSRQNMVLGLGMGELSVNANGHIFIKDNEGTINIKNVLSESGNIILVASGDIVNSRTDRGINFKGNNININAPKIGTEEHAIVVATIDGVLNINAEKDIYLLSKNFTLRLGEIISVNGDLILISEVDIINGLEEGINIKANNIKIKMPEKDIATKEKTLQIDTAINGILKIEARSAYIEEIDSLLLKEAILSGEIILTTGSDNRIETINAQGNVIIIANMGDIYIDTIRSAADIELKANLGGIYNIKSSAGASLNAKIIKIYAGKGIGEQDKYLLMDMIEGGKLTAKAGEDIYIKIINGDINISSIETEKDIFIIVEDSILNGDITKINIIANNIKLQSKLGSIGSQNKHLTIKTINQGHINASTIDKGIYINAVDQDIRLDLIEAGMGRVEIKAKNSILNGLADDAGVNIVASTLYLETGNGDIGQKSEGNIIPIRIELTDITRVDIKARGSVYLEEQTGNLGLGTIIVEGEEFYLTLPGDIYTTLTQEDLLNGIANIRAKSAIIHSLNGQIGEDKNDNLTYLDEDYEGWITTSHIETDDIYEFYIYAKGDIYIREISDSLIIGEIKSTSGDISLSAFIDLKSYNSVGSERINVLGENIYLETTKGIISTIVKASKDLIINSCGSILNMNGEEYDSILISGDNITLISREGAIGSEDSYVEIDTLETGVLNIIAYKGIYIREISGNLTIGSIKSQTGDVMLEVADGRLISNSKDGSINIIGKNIKIVSLTSGIGSDDRYIRIDSDGNIIAEAIGDIYLQEVNGDMLIKHINTLGNIYLAADNNISVAKGIDGAIITGRDMSLTALNGSIGIQDSFITINNINSGSISALANNSIYIKNIEGDLRIYYIDAVDLVSLKTLNSMLAVGSQLHVKANQLILQAYKNIGMIENPLYISSNSIIANAGDNIALTSDGNIHIAQMRAGQTIWMQADNVMGKDLIAEILEITALNSIGNSSKLLMTAVNYVKINAGQNIYLKNVGPLNIISIEGKIIELEAESVRGVNGTAIIGDDLKIMVYSGIGQSKSSPFVTNVNKFTGTTTSGSIYLKNIKNIIINQIKTPNNVYLFISGSLLGEGNNIIANKLIFEAHNVKLHTAVHYMEGKSSKDIIITNTGKLIIGNADPNYQGIQAAGKIVISAKSPIQVSENVISGGELELNAGYSTTMQDSLIIDSATNIQSKTGAVNLFAGDIININSGANINGETEVNIICGQNNPNSRQTLIDITGNIITKTTNISGAATITIFVIDSMGDININAIANGSKMNVLVNSLGGNMNIQGGKGKDHILLDMKNTIKGASRELAIEGNGSQDEYTLLLNAIGNQYTYRIIGKGRANIHTTNKDENIEVYKDRMNIKIAKAVNTIFLNGLDELSLQNPGGNNSFNLYDTPSGMSISTGSGNDKFYIGKLINSSAGNTNTTEGWLTNGSSYPLSINTSGGNNQFVLYSTKAPLRIISGNGNDYFMLKAFIEILSGESLRKYRNNTIFIDAASGNNQLFLMKSALFDHYDIEEDTIKGSGFDITFKNIDDLEIVKFEPAEDSNSEISIIQLIKYSFIQLEESGALYIIIVVLLSLITLLIYKMKKKSKDWGQA